MEGIKTFSDEGNLCEFIDNKQSCSKRNTKGSSSNRRKKVQEGNLEHQDEGRATEMVSI